MLYTTHDDKPGKRPRTGAAARVAAVTMLMAGLLVALAGQNVAGAVGHAAPMSRWTQVNKHEPDRSYWETARDAARVGRSADPKGVFRSFFRIDTSKTNGSRIHKAEFDVSVDTSKPCSPTTLELWAVRPIDPAQPLTWNNSRDAWLGDAPLATSSGDACGGGLLRLEFASDALKALAQRAADERSGFVTLGVKLRNEHLPKGMALKPESAFLTVEYNNPPTVTRVSTSYPSRCGTAEAPTPLNDGRVRQFSGASSDPESSDGITTRLEILRADGSLAYATEVGPIGSGAFSWSELPEGVLVDGQTYHYHAQARDALDVGPSTPDCYFTVDAVRPGVPRISSADFPDGEPVIPARTTGTVTLRAAAGDTDVAEFMYGFKAERVTHRIKAAPDGSAVLPVTVFEDPITHVASARLYVRAVDRAGNVSDLTPSWGLSALDNPAPRAHVPEDMNGDGRSDVTLFMDHDFGGRRIWNVTARDGGFYQGTVVMDAGISSGGLAPLRYVRGDFDGDGRTDVATFTQAPGDRAQLSVYPSDGHGYAGRNTWDSGSAAWPLSTLRMFSGDFTGDGKADVAVQRPADGGGWQVTVFPGGALNAPVVWYTSPGDPAKANLVAGDFDGDGRTDLAELRDEGDCHANLTVHRSTGSAFDAGASTWDGPFCTGRSTPVAADVDGDGKADVVAMYDHGGGDTAMVVFGSTTGFAPHDWWRRTGEFDPAKSVLTTGDFDKDGKADVAVVTANAPGESQLWTLRSTGTAFGARVLGWQEVTGGVPTRPNG
ncbi:FG-GAP repeat domain-containing protein [Amycolatopsis sp. NPDC058986]|uniref:FG-GAP repeat domain-containing protein n=1 Tax=unclassified Amycolatopsis TaxID=2618356 RepID=UPI00366B06B8